MSDYSGWETFSSDKDSLLTLSLLFGGSNFFLFIEMEEGKITPEAEPDPRESRDRCKIVQDGV